MDEPAADWIEFTTHDGRKSRLRADNIGMVTRSSVGDAGTIHTSVGELVRVLNVTHVLRRWRHRLLFVVSRRAVNHHRYLKHAFADVEWANVIFDRRQGERRQQQIQWMVDRRVGGRRTRPDVDERLRTFGWAIVRISRT